MLSLTGLSSHYRHDSRGMLVIDHDIELPQLRARPPPRRAALVRSESSSSVTKLPKKREPLQPLPLPEIGPSKRSSTYLAGKHSSARRAFPSRALPRIDLSVHALLLDEQRPAHPEAAPTQRKKTTRASGSSLKATASVDALLRDLPGLGPDFADRHESLHGEASRCLATLHHNPDSPRRTQKYEAAVHMLRGSWRRVYASDGEAVSVAGY